MTLFDFYFSKDQSYKFYHLIKIISNSYLLSIPSSSLMILDLSYSLIPVPGEINMTTTEKSADSLGWHVPKFYCKCLGSFYCLKCRFFCSVLCCISSDLSSLTNSQAIAVRFVG